VTKKILNLVAGTLGFAVVVAFFSHYLWPELPIPLFSFVASVLCLVPTLVTLLWASWPGNQLPEHQMLMILGGTAVRMTVVFGLGLLLYYTVPAFERMSFWIVILVFYLFTLGLEIALLLSGPSNQPKGKQI
jgi:hypothetical protein